MLPRWVPRILAAMPHEWRGTTFKNEALLGREAFAECLLALLAAKQAAGDTTLSTEELSALGNAEDYLRVATNICTTLEVALAAAQGCSMEHVFTFGSTTMPVAAVVLTAGAPVHLYGPAASAAGTVDLTASGHGHGEELMALLAGLPALLAPLGGKLECHFGGEPQEHPGCVVLALAATGANAGHWSSGVHGIVEPHALYICDAARPAPIPRLGLRGAHS